MNQNPPDPIRILPNMLGQIFWQQLFRNLSANFVAHQEKLMQYYHFSESLRTQAEYNTGSVNLSALYCLFAISYQFTPRTIAEVGSFIGNSTYALAHGVHCRGNEATVFTCDYSNHIELNQVAESGIDLIQFPKQSSSQMFQHLLKEKQTIELLFLDGRLETEDLVLLPDLLHPDSLIVLDDFEGIEKGVANAMLLKKLDCLQHHVLIPPASDQDLAFLPLNGMAIRRHNTAALLPLSRVVFSPQ